MPRATTRETLSGYCELWGQALKGWGSRIAGIQAAYVACLDMNSIVARSALETLVVGGLAAALAYAAGALLQNLA